MYHDVILNLPKLMVGQILDALYQRLETWKYTERYLQTGYADENYCVEECSDAEEAHRIAQYYNEIIKLVEQQAYDCK